MKRGFVFSALLAVTLLSGCGQSSTSETADFNDADVMFAQMMIPHHEQAIEMSEIALDPASGASAAIQDLAIRIRDAQDPEDVLADGKNAETRKLAEEIIANQQSEIDELTPLSLP
jgi:uncharacterized protein (DUF305 family)